MALLGMGLGVSLFIIWMKSGFKLYEYHNYAILGLLLIILGFQTFTFTLIFEIITREYNNKPNLDQSTEPSVKSFRDTYGNPEKIN